MKSTSNDDFLSGNTIATFDFAVLLAEDNVEEEEYEMQREFLEYYLNCPVSGAFTTFAPLRLPDDLSQKLSVKKVIEEDMAGKEAEVLGLLGAFLEELCIVQAEHDNSKV